MNRRGLLRWYRYVPLAILTAIVLAAGATGYAVKHSPPAPPEMIVPGTNASSLPAACAPGVDQGLAGEPWLDPADRPASEAAFTSSIAAENPSYVLGKDGWYFFTDIQANDFSQGLGRLVLSLDQIEAWNSYFETLKKQAEAAGSTFYVVIAPGKWDVYPQQLPDWASALRGAVSLDRLRTAHPELPIIDPRASLREAALTNATYSPLNSHWTPYGGYVAWDQISQCIASNDAAAAGLHVPEISGVSKQADLNEFATNGVVPDNITNWTVPDYVRPLSPVKVTSLGAGTVVPVAADNIVDLTLLPVMTETENPQTNLTALVLRDSTGGAISPLLGEGFARTYQYQHNVGVPDRAVDFPAMLATAKPNVTLFVMTERYFNYSAPKA